LTTTQFSNCVSCLAVISMNCSILRAMMTLKRTAICLRKQDKLLRFKEYVHVALTVRNNIFLGHRKNRIVIGRFINEVYWKQRVNG
jgi:hypothetical protein